MRIRAGFLALIFTAIATATARAQSWESPTFFSPLAHDDLGLYMVDTENTGDLGWVGLWRQSGNLNLGVRAGLAPGAYDWLLGAEFYGPLNLFDPASRFVASWRVAAGAMAGRDFLGDDAVALRIPAGVSFGVRLGSEDAVVVPYVHPRIALDVFAIGEGDQEQTESEINLDVDLGAEIAFRQRFVLRAGFTVGRFDSFGLGLAYRIPRSVVVR